MLGDAEPSSTESNPSLVADFDDEDGSLLANDFGAVDDDESDGRGRRYGNARIPGSRDDLLEDTARVSRIFEAAGNPRFQDMKLKTVRVLRSPDPTFRELALKQARRIATVDWG